MKTSARKQDPKKRLTSSGVAEWLWTRDGEPDGHDLGEVNKSQYRMWSDDVFEAISTLGFKVVKK